MNTAVAAIICVLFTGILVHQIRCLGILLIPTRKGTVQIAFTIVGIIVILGITYFYADMFIHYILGILAAMVFGLSLFKSGITSEGFSYNRSFMGFLAPWHKIEKVRIDLKKNVVVSFSGHGSYELRFRKEDHEKLIGILEQYLPVEVFNNHLC
ncbi:MAG: hypothetical protein ACOCG5_04420 [Candidatus Alkaliphilus sp. MAG34]|jgi:hypothetical protein|nr:hypothetical protein [Clostridiales bacterium]